MPTGLVSGSSFWIALVRVMVPPASSTRGHYGEGRFPNARIGAQRTNGHTLKPPTSDIDDDRESSSLRLGRHFDIVSGWCHLVQLLHPATSLLALFFPNLLPGHCLTLIGTEGASPG